MTANKIKLWLAAGFAALALLAVAALLGVDIEDVKDLIKFATDMESSP